MKPQFNLILALIGLAASQGPVINITNTTVHTIEVGSNGKLLFNPSAAFVRVGEVVKFDFYPVVRSALLIIY